MAPPGAVRYAPAMTETRIVNVAGDDRQCGFDQGVRYRHRLSAMVRSLADLPLGLDGVPRRFRQWGLQYALKGIGHLYLPAHRPALREHAQGRYLGILQGLAEGFETSPAQIYGFHAFEIESGIVGFRMGCTALAFGSSQTDTGAPKLAYNHDFPQAFRPHLMLRRSRPAAPDVARTLCVTYEVLLGAIAGVNEHGLAATINQAFAGYPRRSGPAWLPTTLVVDCLEHCRSVDEAVGRVRGMAVNVGSLLTLVDAAGDRATVELAPGGHAVRRAPGPHRIHYTFNHYQCPETVAREIPQGALGVGLASGYDLHAANLARERRFLELTAGPEARAGWNDARIRTLLSDHEDGVPGENTLCRHDPRLGGDTILSAILDPRARTIRVRWGWPCEGDHGEPVAL